MLDIGGWEIFVILVLALIVVGPKDLPVLVRNVGRWVGKARSLARDFQRGMEEVAKQSDLDDLKKSADVTKDLRSTMRGVRDDIRSADREVRDAGREVRDAGRMAQPPRQAGPARSSPAGSGASGESGAGSRRPHPSGRSAADQRAAPRPSPAPDPRDAGGAIDPRSDGSDDAVLDGFQRGVRGGPSAG